MYLSMLVVIGTVWCSRDWLDCFDLRPAEKRCLEAVVDV